MVLCVVDRKPQARSLSAGALGGRKKEEAVGVLEM
jgi:hypothetical protein